MSLKKVINLDTGWIFRQADDDDGQEVAGAAAEVPSRWLPVSQFPTNIHLDLVSHGCIPDPFHGKNELEVAWVAEQSWIYQTTFTVPLTAAHHYGKTEEEGEEGGEEAEEGKDGWIPVEAVSDARDGNKVEAVPAQTRAELVFEGLDTYATVYLDGEEILRTDNMFTPARVDVTDFIPHVDGREHQLTIRFDSALLIGKSIMEEYPAHHWGCWNGDTSRLAVRKAQYHYGWDWGPALVTCGPWRPVKLELFTSRIEDLYFVVQVHPSLTSAEVVAKADLKGPASTVVFSLSINDSDVGAVEVTNVKNGFASATFHVHNPQLWYPSGYGGQPLYVLAAELLAEEGVTGKQGLQDRVSKKLGLRRAEVVQHELRDAPGTSFFVRVNGIPIFCGGSNWIPADSFLPRVSRRRYRQWVRKAVDGNQVMLRCWGGGVYEDDALYEACDELGVLVWQDFQFACGNYPAFPAFLASVRAEATANVKRLRHHACIVVWAGNNEDYQYGESAGLDYDPRDGDPESWLRGSFPARYIYEKLLVEVMSALAPGVYYHYGSPWGGASTRDATVGDIHQWDVWHGSQEAYQHYDRLGGRFVSEFGMQACPDVRTIDSFLPANPDERYAHSATVEFHNKAAGGERRLAVYLVENIRYSFEPLEHYVHCTQLMQAECLGHALRAWRRQWKGSNREYCAGALIWQLNDCWPATSWSIVDYYLRPKLAYYMVKRELAPITVGMKRSVGTSRSHGAQTLPPKESPAAAGEDLNSSQQQLRQSQKQNDGETIELWGSNLSLEGHTVDVIVRAWNIASGEEVVVPDIMPRRLPGIALPPNRSTEIAKFDVPGALGLVKEPQQDAKAEEGREVKKEQTSAEQTAAQIATVVVVTAYLVSRTDGSVLARAVNWPEPLKHVPLQEEARNLRVTLSQDASQVTVTADVPVKGLTLGALPHHHGEGGGDGGGGGEEKEDDAAFADNCVDIVPGEETTIGVTGLKPDMSRLIVWHLGMVSRCRPTGGESMFGSKSRQ